MRESELRDSLRELLQTAEGILLVESELKRARETLRAAAGFPGTADSAPEHHEFNQWSGQ